MQCVSPLTGFRLPDGTVRFKGERVRALPDRLTADMARVSCGQCVGCRLENSRSWAVRVMHEAQLYDANSFVTLTYNPENLPADGSLDLGHAQEFMKKLRRRFGKVRYLHCGEYGEQRGRPHYHFCLLGVDFRGDRRFFKTSGGFHLYTSAALDSCWGRGHAIIGDLTFESAAYVSRYVIKKRTGPGWEQHYERAVDPDTGEVLTLKREYATMSRRPGLGRRWIERWHDEVYGRDRVVMQGKEMRPPKYYDRVFEEINPERLEEVKQQRVEERSEEESPDRLEVLETVMHARMRAYLREVE